MPTRSANAVWKGNLKQGAGQMRFGTFEGRYSAPSRFEQAEGTNPEELLGAAHAGCFSMALAGLLAEAGHQPDELRTEARVTVERGEDGYSINRIELRLEARVPGLEEGELQRLAQQAKANCPVSRALRVEDIRLEARLV